MKIRNTSNKVIGVSNGIFLLPDTTADVSDALAENITIKVLIERGMLCVVEEPKAEPKVEKEPSVPVETEEAPVENTEAEPEKPRRTRKKKTEVTE